MRPRGQVPRLLALHGFPSSDGEATEHSTRTWYLDRMFIRDLLRALADAAVPYCVVGGVAVNLHGVPRMTYDIDLVVPTTSEALRQIDEVLVRLGLQCRLPIKLVDLADDALREQLRAERNLIAVTYTDLRDPLREVDILVSPPIPAAQLVAGAVTHQMDEIPVHIISVSDLIEMKRATGRAQDLADVALLERLREQQR